MTRKKTTVAKLPTRQCEHCCLYFNPETIEGAVHLASCKKYNGWINFETWNVGLWIDNEEGSQNYWRERAQECLDNASATTYATRAEVARADLATELKNEIRDGEFAPDLGATMYADLLSAALSEVDWHDLAEHILADLEPSDAEGDES